MQFVRREKKRTAQCRFGFVEQDGQQVVIRLDEYSEKE